jgi:hypothetical protein
MQANDELLYSEVVRTVKADVTFSFHGRRYEASCDVRTMQLSTFQFISLDTFSALINDFSAPSLRATH